MLKTTFHKFVLGVLVLALGLAALPLSAVSAADLNDPITPPATAAQMAAHTRLELAFVREKARVERIGIRLAASNARLAKVQKWIDRAKTKGLDVAAVQAALDAFKAALAQGKPIFDQAKALADSHAGFDVNGQVTDLSSARTTVKSLHKILQQYTEMVDGPFKALREAIRAFRTANPK
jgi:hypothetical protein